MADPGYGNEEIAAALAAEGLKYEKPASIEAEIGRLLAEGYVVARFKGRMEYGPRALGSRSRRRTDRRPPRLRGPTMRRRSRPGLAGIAWLRARSCRPVPGGEIGTRSGNGDFEANLGHEPAQFQGTPDTPSGSERGVGKRPGS